MGSGLIPITGFLVEIDSAFWWNAGAKTDNEIAEGICLRFQPDIHAWLRTQPRHPWQYVLETVLDMHGQTILFVASVMFHSKADLALYMVFFGGRDRTHSERFG